MGKIRKRIGLGHSTTGWNKSLVGALHYIETGDLAALNAIQKTKGWEYWRATLVTAMDPPSRCDEEDQRALQVLAWSGGYLEVRGMGLPGATAGKARAGRRTRSFATRSRPAGSRSRRLLLSPLPGSGASRTAGQPNSAGRYVLELSNQDLRAAVSQSAEGIAAGYLRRDPCCGLIELLFSAAPERLDLIVPALLEPERLRSATSALLLQKGGHRFEGQIVQAWRGVKDAWTRFEHSKLLVAHDPALYRDEALAISSRDQEA